jgi:hypothetical protein
MFGSEEQDVFTFTQVLTINGGGASSLSIAPLVAADANIASYCCNFGFLQPKSLKIHVHPIVEPDSEAITMLLGIDHTKTANNWEDLKGLKEKVYKKTSDELWHKFSFVSQSIPITKNADGTGKIPDTIRWPNIYLGCWEGQVKCFIRYEFGIKFFS